MRRLDPFLLVIIATALVASFLPVRGWGAEALSVVSVVAITLLFFLYGARLATTEALKALGHWRLHLAILSLTYVAFPLVGLAIGTTLSAGGVSGHLATGLVYLTLVPSTVQASITFTSLARGNVAGAIVAASASNLLGVILTPVLVALLCGRSGEVGWGTVGALAGQLLAPFVVGQLLRRWIGEWVSTHHTSLKLIDQGVIVLVVYGAFSSAARTGAFRDVTWAQLLLVLAVSAGVLAVMLVLSWWLGGVLRFCVEDRIAVQFCGTKKSLATGLPMAVLIFGPSAGLVVMPLMVFHQLQLLVSSLLASRYARRA